MRKQYKGGLHIHTTVSDGGKSPSDTIAAYKAAGYDFIALTDHWKFGQAGEYNGMEILSGIEYDTGSNIRDGIFHIVGIGCGSAPDLTRDMLGEIDGSVKRAQFIIDRINEAGGAAVLAHPAWSINRPSDIIRLRGLSGVEMYNAVSGYPFGNRALSDSILDICAADGWTLPVLASDDTHFWGGEECSSYICTSERDFKAAVKNGSFYASRGPRLEVTRDGDSLHIECTPAASVVMQTGTVWISGRVTVGVNLTEHDYTIKPSDIFARAEVTDSDGNTAWSGYYLKS